MSRFVNGVTPPGTASPRGASARAQGAASLGELLRSAATSYSDSEIVFPDERVSFRQLDETADRVAAMLVSLGVAAGSKVGILLRPSVNYVAALFGIARAGCTIVPISDRFRVRELAYAVRHADVAVLLTFPRTEWRDYPTDLLTAFPELATQATASISIDEAPLLRHVVILGADHADAPFMAVEHLTQGPLTPGLAQQVEARQAAVDPGALAYLMYTSGTSAEPKACMISHDAVLRQANSLATTRYSLTVQDSFWCPLQLFHNGGLATLTACVASGATFVHCGVFDPGVALEQLEQEGCTHAIPTFETIWMPILNHPRYAQADLSRLRMMLHAGSEQWLRQCQARTPQATLLANYGCTEAGGHLSMTLPSDSLELRVTTGGHPLPGMEVRTVDPVSMTDCAAGEPGEILFRGPSRFDGYFKDPEATVGAIDADGWYHSGDLGVLDENGRITFSGRLKDMLKVGGENVSALEVESYLLSHPAVGIVVVVGAPDDYYTEVPAAYVQLNPGATVTEVELIDYCLGNIATFKVPRYIRFVTEWPMSGTKIRKYALRDAIAAELKAADIRSAPRLRAKGPGDSDKPGTSR